MKFAGLSDKFDLTLKLLRDALAIHTDIELEKRGELVSLFRELSEEAQRLNALEATVAKCADEARAIKEELKRFDSDSRAREDKIRDDVEKMKTELREIRRRDLSTDDLKREQDRIERRLLDFSERVIGEQTAYQAFREKIQQKYDNLEKEALELKRQESKTRERRDEFEDIKSKASKLLEGFAYSGQEMNGEQALREAKRIVANDGS